ncbi:hypothetical protein [Verminephrobacter aporrectodeae]|uniref:hypothetical protein n=1 Tax=Verminephrobacter aporrectodeae TaxID=1110389 RepID=UPI0022433BF2|nr:hypothetical protein [Verminephrobacter aporrectodeae]
MVENILNAFASCAMPMHPAAYQELAGWARESFRPMESGALRTLRDAAPTELRVIIENVLHERRVITWSADDAVGLSAWAISLNLLSRCRLRS